jgi:hypothetical protein
MVHTHFETAFDIYNFHYILSFSAHTSLSEKKFRGIFELLLLMPRQAKDRFTSAIAKSSPKQNRATRP